MSTFHEHRSVKPRIGGTVSIVDAVDFGAVTKGADAAGTAEAPAGLSDRARSRHPMRTCRGWCCAVDLPLTLYQLRRKSVDCTLCNDFGGVRLVRIQPPTGARSELIRHCALPRVWS